jgi:hypothetical protein
MKTVAEVLAMPDGAIVEAVGGKLTVTGERVNRVREDCSAYSSQTFSLTDATGTILGTAFDQFPLDVHNNKQVVMASLKSRNNHFGGVSVSQQQPAGSLFARRPRKAVLRVSKAAGVHSPDTYAHLCATTKRPS